MQWHLGHGYLGNVPCSTGVRVQPSAPHVISTQDPIARSRGDQGSLSPRHRAPLWGQGWAVAPWGPWLGRAALWGAGDWPYYGITGEGAEVGSWALDCSGEAGQGQPGLAVPSGPWCHALVEKMICVYCRMQEDAIHDLQDVLIREDSGKTVLGTEK